MRNLKKVLSLVLAMAMMLSVMVVGAGATYSDAGEIDHLDAVYTLSALGIVEGRETGEFEPGDTLSRAEAAKLVACLNLSSNPVPNANGVSSFTDVVNTPNVAWANDYIEYGVAQGSIAGVGGDRFAPNSEVTGVQLAKMLLALLGWDADAEGYTGAMWEYNVNIDAVTANLYVELGDIDPTAPITRDDAAQMMLNALQAQMVIYPTGTTGALDTIKPLWVEKYPNVEWGMGTMMAIDYDVEDAEYTYTIQNDAAVLDTADDYTDLLGLHVLWFTDGDDVLGIYAYENDTIVSGLAGDIDPAADEWKNFDPDFADVFKPVGDDGVHSVTLIGPTMNRGDVHDFTPYTAIDYDGDGEFDRVIFYYVTAGEITRTSKDDITVGSDKYDRDCNEIFAGAAAGDIALIEAYTDLVKLYEISEFTAETAVVESIDCGETGLIEEIVIGGEAYDYHRCLVLNHQPEYWPGKTVDFYTINGYVVALTENTSLAADFLLITSIQHGCNADGKTINGTALFADNTSKVITISELDGVTGTEIATIVDDYLDQSKDNTQHGYLVRYDEVDGKYELTSTAYVNPADVGFDGAVANYDFPAYERPVFWPAKNNTEDAFITAGDDFYHIADDAVVFLADTTDGVSYKVVSGADIKHMTGFSFVEVYYAAYETVDGYEYATLLFMEAAPKYISVDMTGILTSDVTSRFVDGDKYAIFSLWNGEEEITVNAAMEWYLAADLFAMSKGDIITFAMDAGKVVKVDFVKGTVGAITGVAGIGNSLSDIEIDEVDRIDVASDATIWFFDTDKDVLAPYEGEVGMAFNTTGAWVDNVFYTVNGEGAIDFMVIDTDEFDTIQINSENLLP